MQLMVTAKSMRTLETLAGLLEGVAIDAHISRAELEGLQRWYATHRAALEPALFADLRRLVEASLNEGITPTRHRELLAYCRDFGAKHTPTHPSTRQAFARLQGMALGLLADGRLDDAEIIDLRGWLEDYAEYRHHFVFEAFFEMLDEVLRAGEITSEGRERIRNLCETFGAPPPPRELPPGVTPVPNPHEPRRAPPPRWPPLPDPTGADFVTLDLETANAEPTSVCAMGLALVREGKLDAVGATLVDPEGPFDPLHTRIHGIGAGSARGSGRFADHFSPLAGALAGRWVLAHNATFTARCLSALWWKLGEPAPEPPRLLCTLRLARAVWPQAESHALERLARTLSFTLPKHDPAAGARSCAELALLICKRRRLMHPADVAAELGVAPTELL